MTKKRRRRKRWPEPGNWVDHQSAGLPSLEEPEPLPNKPTVEDIKQQIEYEGLGYCVYDLIPANKIRDMRLRGLWKKARLALREIVEYLDNPRKE